MSGLRHDTGVSRSRSGIGLRVALVVATLWAAAGSQGLWAQAPPPPPAYAQQPPAQLQQLVAPIALYPDSLVAQILAAATYPEQIVEADRWLQSQRGASGEALAQAVDQQPWDASVKALTAFPSVLASLDRNLSWTSSLGDAYYNQPEDVMAAVQVMRERAQAAGNLMTTPQQMVTTQDSNIVIEPVSPDVVYVPAYDPWAVYGAPILPWAGWYPYPGLWFGGPYLSFGVGFPVRFYTGFGWGWRRWRFNWHHHVVLLNNNPYYSRSATFFNRRNFYGGVAPRGAVGGRFGSRPAPRGGAGERSGSRPVSPGAAGQRLDNRMAPRSGVSGRPGVVPRPFGGNAQAARGYAAPRGQAGVSTGAFSGFNRGGETRGFAARGRESLGEGAPRVIAPRGVRPPRGAGAPPGGGARPGPGAPPGAGGSRGAGPGR